MALIQWLTVPQVRRPSDPGALRKHLSPSPRRLLANAALCRCRARGPLPGQGVTSLSGSRLPAFSCGSLHLANSYSTSSHSQISELLDFPFYLLLLPYSSAAITIEHSLLLRPLVITLYPPSNPFFRSTVPCNNTITGMIFLSHSQVSGE